MHHSELTWFAVTTGVLIKIGSGVATMPDVRKRSFRYQHRLERCYVAMHHSVQVDVSAAFIALLQLSVLHCCTDLLQLASTEILADTESPILTTLPDTGWRTSDEEDVVSTQEAIRQT